LLSKLGTVVSFNKLISLVWLDKVLLILFIFVVFDVSYDFKLLTSCCKFVIFDSSVINLLLMVDISLVLDVILVLLTLLSASRVDTLLWRVVILALFKLLSDFKLDISTLLFELSIFNNDTSPSIFVDLVLFEAWYVVRLDWTFEISWASFKLNVFNAVDNELKWLVSVVKLSVIFEFNSLLSAIWVFLFVVICDCKSL